MPKSTKDKAQPRDSDSSAQSKKDDTTEFDRAPGRRVKTAIR